MRQLSREIRHLQHIQHADGLPFVKQQFRESGDGNAIARVGLDERREYVLRAALLPMPQKQPAGRQ